MTYLQPPTPEHIADVVAQYPGLSLSALHRNGLFRRRRNRVCSREKFAVAMQSAAALGLIRYETVNGQTLYFPNA